MPRLKSLMAVDQAEKQFLALIDRHMRLIGKKSYRELSEITGKSDRTMFNRQKKPGDFTFEEIFSLMRGLNIEPSELVDVFKGTM